MQSHFPDRVAISSCGEGKCVVESLVANTGGKSSLVAIPGGTGAEKEDIEAIVNTRHVEGFTRTNVSGYGCLVVLGSEDDHAIRSGLISYSYFSQSAALSGPNEAGERPKDAVGNRFAEYVELNAAAIIGDPAKSLTRGYDL